MSLPQIAAYNLPPEHYPNRVHWQLEKDRAALLVHDLQNHFVDVFDRAENSQIERCIGATRALVETARQAGVPVYYTAQPPRQKQEERALLTDFWGEGLQQDAAAEILPALAPKNGDRVLKKWRYSAFARTDLEEELKSGGRDQLIITGVYAHIGCLTTALEAFMRDIQAFFVADALADFTLEEHRMACNYAARRCARVLSTEQVLAELTAQNKGS